MRGASSTAYSAPDLGFAILPEETRKGYPQEASEGLQVWAENKRGVHDVLGLHDPSNEGPKGVLRSLGFTNRAIHTLKEFGDVQGAVWVNKVMNSDLSVYTIWKWNTVSFLNLPALRKLVPGQLTSLCGPKLLPQTQSLQTQGIIQNASRHKRRMPISPWVDSLPLQHAAYAYWKICVKAFLRPIPPRCLPSPSIGTTAPVFPSCS